MDASTPILEEILIYLGHVICLSAAVYMVKIGQVKIGLLLLVAFLLQIQAGLVVAHIDADLEAQGACWATVGSYYDCLPILHRISIHAAQIGTILLAVAILLSARKLSARNV
jgi:uncharacterized membrane protein YwaF